MSGEAARAGGWPAQATVEFATIVQASRLLLKAEWFICRSYFFMPAGMFM
jgi:hypothetical protein